MQEGQLTVGDIRVTNCRREELYIYAARRRMTDIVANGGAKDSPEGKTYRREWRSQEAVLLSGSKESTMPVQIRQWFDRRQDG
jgi:hypothetical protein